MMLMFVMIGVQGDICIVGGAIFGFGMDEGHA